MQSLFSLSFDAMVTSLFICLLLRQAMILLLPDHIAGPGGWLVDTKVRGEQ
ncbi:hypothetical protein ABIE69_001445 [Rhodobacteraceae bacterium MBR-64]|jgi:hypothetical protein